MTDYRLIIRATGGPDAIEREAIDAAALVPGPGEARVRQSAVGLNFIDTYQRSGLYPITLPSGLGAEGVGVVEAVGEGVEDVRVGDRVAYGTGPLGAYATVRTMPAEHLVVLPDDVTEEAAAAAMLKGMTACYLIEECAKVERGQAVLVHAAAGGMGSILVPWLARVGAASWKASLASLARRGLLVTYGNASGPVPPFTALDLMAAGSVFVTRPTLAHYGATAAERRRLAGRVFAMMREGVDFPIGQRFPLAEAAAAQRALEARQTRSATVLTV